MIWMAVTPDEYELPMAVADTASELSLILGLKKHGVTELFHKHNAGILKKYDKYKIVKVVETEEGVYEGEAAAERKGL